MIQIQQIGKEQNGMSQCSISAYELVSKELGKRQAQCLHAIFELKEASNYQISQFLKLPINCVTGRTRELHLKNRIYSKKVDYDGNSKVKVNFWAIRGGYR